MHKSVFLLEDYPKAYMGYTPDMKWELWDMPHFELATAKEIMEDCKHDDHPISYDEGNDYFKVWDEGNGRYRMVVGMDCETEDGIKHLYAIGSRSWMWDSANEGIRRYLAEVIEDFIYEYDTYHYRDECLDRMQTVEGIHNQLQELETFKQIYDVWCNEELSRAERFEELSKLLFI